MLNMDFSPIWTEHVLQCCACAADDMALCLAVVTQQLHCYVVQFTSCFKTHPVLNYTSLKADDEKHDHHAFEAVALIISHDGLRLL